MPRAVIFDFDGTLADSYPAITSSVNHVRAIHGLAPLAEAEVRKHVGRGLAYLLEHTVPGTDIPGDSVCYRVHHPTVMREGTRLMPGAAEAIAALRRAGRKIAVCSNKPRDFTRQLLDHFELLPIVDACLGPEDVPHPKPAPDMLLAALRQLDVSPAEALYVGDMTVDIETARAAGVAVVVVPTGSDSRSALEAARPDRLLRDLTELAHLLKT